MGYPLGSDYTPPGRLEAECEAKSNATSARSSRVKALLLCTPTKKDRRAAQMLVQYEYSEPGRCSVRPIMQRLMGSGHWLLVVIRITY